MAIYETPEIKILRFEEENVVTDSSLPTAIERAKKAAEDNWGDRGQPVKTYELFY